MKTFTSFSFGCRVNMAEKEALDRQMMSRGYTQNEENPSVYVLNTCSVTHKAEREARQMINQIRKKHPETKIVVMGCAATNWIKTKATVENADLLVENPSKEFIADIIEKHLQKGPGTIQERISRFEADQAYKSAHNSQKTAKNGPLADDKYTRSGRIIYKIQDGCQRFCTYCIVPYLRGLPKSIPMEELVGHINLLPDSIKEVIYTAINTEAYGYDTKTHDFLDLVQYTLENTRIPRLSFGSIHPWSINEKLFAFMRNHKEARRMSSFFHIPLQSGNNKMLSLMKRGYTREEFVEKLHELVKIEPMAFIGTDIIVGFLEESDTDFEDTYRFLEETPVARTHIFRYSERQHTAASYLGKRLREPDPHTKLKRAKALGELNTRKYTSFLEKHIGKSFEALFLEQRDENAQLAVLSNGVSVWVPTEQDLRTELRTVRVDARAGQALFGKLS